MQPVGLCDCTHHTCCMTLEKRKPTISLRLPTELLHQVDELVRRTGSSTRWMNSFVGRACDPVRSLWNGPSWSTWRS